MIEYEIPSSLSPVVFSKKSDEWETPDALFAQLSEEFCFTLDAAATAANAKVPNYLGPDREEAFFRNALYSGLSWTTTGAVWLNPPYSKVGEFVEKAVAEARMGQTIVMLLPARTDTKWFHTHLYQKPGVEIRFLRGRLRFKGGLHSAPFPSMVVVLWGRRGR
jgi:phage N-6-adenine-methyltransferase